MAKQDVLSQTEIKSKSDFVEREQVKAPNIINFDSVKDSNDASGFMDLSNYKYAIRAIMPVLAVSAMTIGSIAQAACDNNVDMLNTSEIQTVNLKLPNSDTIAIVNASGISIDGVNYGYDHGDYYYEIKVDINKGLVYVDNRARCGEPDYIVNLYTGDIVHTGLHSDYPGNNIEPAGQLEVQDGAAEEAEVSVDSVSEVSVNEQMQNEVHKAFSEAPQGADFAEVYLSLPKEITAELNAGHDVVAIVTQAIKNRQEHGYTPNEILDAAEKSETLAYMLQMASEKGMAYPHLFEFRTTPDKSEEPYAKPNLAEAGPMIYGEVTEARLAALEEAFSDDSITRTLALGMTQFGVEADGQSYEVGDLDITRVAQGVVNDKYTISNSDIEATVYVSYMGNGDMVLSTVSIGELK